MCPAQSRPSSVVASYFMSRYALDPGDMRSLAPARAAATNGAGSTRVSQYCTTVPRSSGVVAISCQPTTCLPDARTAAAACATSRAYSSGSIVRTSSPPMCTYGPRVSSATSVNTSRRNSLVAGRSAYRREKPTSIPVYTSVGTPSGVSSPYACVAALTCPGTSISGTTVMPRIAAYCTSSEKSLGV